MKVLIRLNLLWLVLLISVVLNAQRSDKQQLPAGTVLARFNLLNLANPLEPAVSLGAEYKVNRRWSVCLDAGYIFYSQLGDNVNGITSGLLLRPAVRRYFGHQLRLFLEAEGHYKTVSNRRTDWVGRDCVAGVPAYEEYMPFHLLSRQVGMSVKWGYQGSLFSSKHIWFEVYAGIGWKYRFEPTVKEPNTCYVQPVQNWIVLFPNADQAGPVPMIPVGFRLMYIINGNR